MWDVNAAIGSSLKGTKDAGACGGASQAHVKVSSGKGFLNLALTEKKQAEIKLCWFDSSLRHPRKGRGPSLEIKFLWWKPRMYGISFIID